MDGKRALLAAVFILFALTSARGQDSGPAAAPSAWQRLGQKAKGLIGRESASESPRPRNVSASGKLSAAARPSAVRPQPAAGKEEKTKQAAAKQKSLFARSQKPARSISQFMAEERP
jgi:hypothetical protein